MQYLSQRSNNPYYKFGIEPIPGDTIPSMYQGRMVCDPTVPRCWYYDDVANVWKEHVSGLPASRIPEMSGAISVYGDSDIKIDITNFGDFLVPTTHTVTVTHGSFTGPDVSGVITWSVPTVMEDTLAKIYVTALEPDKTMSTGVYPITIVLFDPVTAAQTITYDSGNMTQFTNLWNMTPTTTLNSDYHTGDVFASTPASTTTKIYVDQTRVVPQVGDTFEIQDGELFVVATVVAGADLYVTPEVVLSVAPTQLEWKNHKADAVTVTQDVSMPGWTTIETPTVIEVMNNVIDTSTPSTVSEIYIDRGKFTARVGDIMHTDAGQFEVKTSESDETTLSKKVGQRTIAAGQNFSMVIRSDGTVWGTGDNSYGQLGLGSTRDKEVFTQSDSAGNDNASIYCGKYHSVILKENGDLWACGNGDSYQLGNGSSRTKKTFVKCNISNVKNAWVGNDHTVAVLNDDTVWAVGDNSYGQMAQNSGTSRYKNWVQAKDTGGSFVTGAKQVSSGGHFITIVKNDGTVWAVGRGTTGQLAIGSTSDKRGYVQCKHNSGFLTGIDFVACGGQYVLAIKQGTGRVWGCGDNYGGQLGLGYATTGGTPIQKFRESTIEGDNCVDVGGRSGNTLIVKADGTVWGAGGNDLGELGLGGTARKTTFTITNSGSTDNGFTETRVGSTLLQKMDGSLWGTGLNDYDELGMPSIYQTKTFKNIGFETLVPIDMKYWVTPVVNLATVPTYVYPITELAINNLFLTISSISLGGSSLTTLFNDEVFAVTNTVDVHVRSPELARVQKITMNAIA